jgi:hypothetical protein
MIVLVEQHLNNIKINPLVITDAICDGLIPGFCTEIAINANPV